MASVTNVAKINYFTGFLATDLLHLKLEGYICKIGFTRTRSHYLLMENASFQCYFLKHKIISLGEIVLDQAVKYLFVKRMQRVRESALRKDI